MPDFGYKCPRCKKTFELYQAKDGNALRFIWMFFVFLISKPVLCPQCKKVMERIISIFNTEKSRCQS